MNNTEYYEIKIYGYGSEYAYDTQELIYKICDLVNGSGLEQDKDFEVITHTRRR